MLTVFWFKTFDPVTGRWRRAPKKATERHIRELGGEKIWGSAEGVADDALDGDGFYLPPQGHMDDLSPQNRILIQRVCPTAHDGHDWNMVELSGIDLDRVLDAARREGVQDATSPPA